MKKALFGVVAGGLLLFAKLLGSWSPVCAKHGISKIRNKGKFICSKCSLGE